VYRPVPLKEVGHRGVHVGRARLDEDAAVRVREQPRVQPAVLPAVGERPIAERELRERRERARRERGRGATARRRRRATRVVVREGAVVDRAAARVLLVERRLVEEEVGRARHELERDDQRLGARVAQDQALPTLDKEVQHEAHPARSRGAQLRELLLAAGPDQGVHEAFGARVRLVASARGDLVAVQQRNAQRPAGRHVARDESPRGTCR
jgi:hypothetical protein